MTDGGWKREGDNHYRNLCIEGGDARLSISPQGIDQSLWLVTVTTRKWTCQKTVPKEMATIRALQQDAVVVGYLMIEKAP